MQPSLTPVASFTSPSFISNLYYFFVSLSPSKPVKRILVKQGLLLMKTMDQWWTGQSYTWKVKWVNQRENNNKETESMHKKMFKINMDRNVDVM